MDRVIERRPASRRRVAVAGAVVLLGGAGFYMFAPDSQRSQAVAASHISIARVTRGDFDDVVAVRGRVAPLRTTYVDTAPGGQVEHILIEDGARVTRGQLLVELSNTALQLDLIAREAQITEQLNALRGLELAQAQTKLTHEREMVEVRYHVKRLSRQLSTAKQLLVGGAVARADVEDMADELEYYRHRFRIQTQTRAEADRLQRAQLLQMRGATEQLEKNLEIARKNLDSLNVRAPADGTLSAFTLEVGQSLAPGVRIAQIDDPDHFKVAADIDEFYLSRVALQQRADYAPTSTTSYPLQIARIRPEVKNGQFAVELTFTGETPADVRRGQTAQIRLQLGQPEKAVLVPNAAFYNDTGGAWVFVVSPDHTSAVKRKVRMGRRNPSHIEILEGLSAGEEIVTSPYTSYLEVDRLDLTR